MIDRLTTWLLRLTASAMLLAGASGLIAGVASSGLLTGGSTLLRTLASVAFQLACVFISAGATALYLSRSRRLQLPNERTTTAAADRPQVGGWLTALAVFLVALPVWMILRLVPFLTEWRRTIDVIAASGPLDASGSSMAGLVLLPVAAALLPPLFELAAMFACAGGSAILLVLLLRRSPLFPRTYLVCVVLMGAWVVASVIGASAATATAHAIERLMEDSGARPGEAADLRNVLGRYTGIVGSTAPVLVWTSCAYLVWVPSLLSSQRVRTTFASTAANPANDIEAVTRPPRFPG